MTMTHVFSFRAAAMDGRIDGGTIDAGSNEEARDALMRRGLFVLEIRDRGTRRMNRAPINTAELALGLRVLSDLLESGLPVARALHVFEELAPKGWRNALPAIRQSVREGHGLAAALAAAPVEIPGLVVGIAQAGEAGGGIGPAIRRAADLTESIAETKAAIRSALAYPAIVAFAGACAVFVLVTVVLPRFAAILQDLGQPLPTATRLVLNAGALARAATFPAAITCALAALGWKAWTSREAGRRSWHRLLLNLPFIGSIRFATGVARAMHALSALIENGVRVSAALPLAARAAGDAELEARFLASRAPLSAGQTFSRAVEGSRAVTPTALRLIRAGEESGRLSAMLGHAARIEQQAADRKVKVAVRMLEPALLLSFASIVAVVAAALLQAIYSVKPVP